MARTSSAESLANKISKAQATVDSLKERLAKAQQELNDLKQKQAALDNKVIMDAVAKSGKSVDEILTFLNDSKTE